MKAKRVSCDKCTESFEQFLCCKIRVKNSTIEPYYSDLPDIYLCVSCTQTFTNWLKGEPIPKQTTA